MSILLASVRRISPNPEPLWRPFSHYGPTWFRTRAGGVLRV